MFFLSSFHGMVLFGLMGMVLGMYNMPPLPVPIFSSTHV